MNRIEETFSRLRKEGRKALITFITAGDPDLETTEDLIYGLEEAGADMIELGIPFSDPMADGPTIQASSERALRGGVTLKDVLRLVKNVRERSDIPIILFGYYNPIFRYGVERLPFDAKEAGADGLLVVDLPPEEAWELQRHTDRAGIDLIFLLTPTSDETRMELVARRAKGFIYYVSVTGVTGTRDSLPDDIKLYVERARRFTDLPIGIGFGISGPEQAATVSRWADGIIVGSAIIKIIERYGKEPDLVDRVKGFVKDLKEAMERCCTYEA